MARGIPLGAFKYPNGLSVRFIRKHKPGCMVRERIKREGDVPPSHAWCFAGVEYRDYHGRRREVGGRRWLRYRCNDGGCTAELFVSEANLLLAAGVPLQ